jgi:aminotransferase EvaB
MSIKVWDYLTEYAAERDDILAAVDQVFCSGRLVLGESVAAFEREFSAYCGVRFGVGVDNATNGLCLSLKALGIGTGDEVITVANTAVPTVSAIVQAGAVPRFVDIDPATYLMDVTLVEQAITERTRCVIPVHLYGQCVDMTALSNVVRKHNLVVIEDCSQSHGAVHCGRKAGAIGDLAVFSFYPTKPLGAYGDGGIIVTNRSDLDERLRRLRFYGMENRYYAEETGYNSRLDEVQAEILRRKLQRLDRYLDQRREIAARYDSRLASTSLRLPETIAGNTHGYYLYVCRHPEREKILAALMRHNIQPSISYPWPIHTMRGFSGLGYKEGDLPHTEAAAREIFSLPMYPTLPLQAQHVVCDALIEAIKGLNGN